MKTGIYWQDPKYAVGSDWRVTDPALVLDLPLYKLDGASFMSKDAYGHLCTVTGALWTPYGRSFDGSDDNISCGYSGLDALTNASVLIWAKPNIDLDTIELHRPLWAIWKDNDNEIKIYYSKTYNEFRLTLTEGGNAVNVSLSASMKTQSWWFSAITLGSAGVKAYLNGVSDTTNPSTRCFDGIATITNHYLSQMSDMFASNSWPGYKGEYWIYNRALSLVEIQHIYNCTIWRYQ